MPATLEERTLDRLIADRKGSPDPFGYGIGTALPYVKSVVECVDGICLSRFGSLDSGELLKSAAKRLTYANEDMGVTKALTGSFGDILPDGVSAPDNTLMVFRNVITTKREDRDRDVLFTDGAEPDLKMPLLWQHIQTLPIGKLLAIDEHTDVKMSAFTAIIDVNELASDAAKLVEAGALRISHGFLPKQWRERIKDREDKSDLPVGFDVLKFEVMEESVVSVPSNVDAEITLFSRGKLKSALANAHAKRAFDARPKSSAGFDLSDFANQLKPVKAGCSCDAKSAGFKEPTRDREEGEEIKKPKRVKHTMGSKGFTVEGEHLEASKLEYEWASRHCQVEVKDLMVCHTFVSSMDAGSYFYAEDEITKSWDLRDKRRLTRDGKEMPLDHELIQLDSRQNGTFMVEGKHFYKLPNGEGLVVKHEKTWGGYWLTTYSKSDEGQKLTADCWKWVNDNHFLKGERFRLSGGFVNKTGDTLDDVFLEEENKSVLRRSIDVINRRGASMASRGAVFMGPPGTGKTLSARVLMNEVKDATFIWVAGRDAGYYGSSAVTSAFDLAQRLAPSVVFFEDCDNLLRRSYVVDLMKTEMDGLNKNDGVLTLLATNHPEQFPKALIDRPGRFHDVCNFDLPSKEVRVKMIQRWTGDGLSGKELIDAAEKAEGLSGAHVYELCHFAKTLRDEDENLNWSDAYGKAFDKMESQRQLLSDDQRVSRYRMVDTWDKSVGMSDPKAVVVKAGRTISKANETKLEEALRLMSEATAKVAGVVDSVKDESHHGDEDDARERDEDKSADVVARHLTALSATELMGVKTAIDAVLGVQAQDEKAAAYRRLVGAED